jgi:hypothetical protein
MRSAPRVHAELERVFASALREVRSFAAPIEDVATHGRSQVESALRALKALERALKQGLPGALGVTLTFTSLDAD